MKNSKMSLKRSNKSGQADLLVMISYFTEELFFAFLIWSILSLIIEEIFPTSVTEFLNVNMIFFATLLLSIVLALLKRFVDRHSFDRFKNKMENATYSVGSLKSIALDKIMNIVLALGVFLLIIFLNVEVTDIVLLAAIVFSFLSFIFVNSLRRSTSQE